MNEKKTYHPFSISEETAWNEVLKQLAEYTQVPPRALFQSRIRDLKKSYLPVRKIQLQYFAKWSATSIFMEYWTETDTHYEWQTRYVDHWGKDHDHMGFDYIDPKTGKWKSGRFHPVTSRTKAYTGSRESIPWKLQNMNVPITEEYHYERETGRKFSSGEYKNATSIDRCEEKGLFDILFSGLKIQAIPCPLNFSDTENIYGKMPSGYSQEERTNAISAEKKEAERQCISQIPGQKYANFQMDFSLQEAEEVCYYPVYSLIYSYDGTDYECLISGCEKGKVFCKKMPDDAEFKRSMDSFDEEKGCVNQVVNEKSNEVRKKVILLFIILPAAWMLAYEIGGFWLFLPTLAIVIYVAKKLIPKWYREVAVVKQGITDSDQRKEEVTRRRNNAKQNILKTMLDENLSPQEKLKRCEEFLEY